MARTKHRQYKHYPPLIAPVVYTDPLPLRSRYTLTTAIEALLRDGSISDIEAMHLWTGTDSPRRTEYTDGRSHPTDSGPHSSG